MARLGSYSADLYKDGYYFKGFGSEAKYFVSLQTIDQTTFSNIRITNNTDYDASGFRLICLEQFEKRRCSGRGYVGPLMLG